MKVEYSAKPQLSHSPDTYFGKPGNITFAFRKGHFIWAKNGYLYVDGKKIMKLPEDVRTSKMFHKNLMALYGQYTGQDEYENARKEDLDKLIRGRTNPQRTSFNLWGNPPENVVKTLLKLAVKYGIIKRQPEYVISSTGRSGTKVYTIDDEELKASSISPHQAIRHHIYKTLHLEAKRINKALNQILENIKNFF